MLKNERGSAPLTVHLDTTQFLACSRALFWIAVAGVFKTWPNSRNCTQKSSLDKTAVGLYAFALHCPLTPSQWVQILAAIKPCNTLSQLHSTVVASNRILTLL